VLVAGWAIASCFSTTVQAAPQTPSRPRPCTVAFPGAHSKTIGKTTWYNRQSSVENVVCFGFGLKPSADFPITAEMVCGLAAQAIGAKADTLSLFVDGACSGTALAADPREPAQYVETACSWVSDLLEKLARPVGVVGSIGCTFAPSVGHSLGGVLESQHELDVAADIIDRGQCLKYSPTHFGSPWLAVACASGDTGFSTLPTAVRQRTSSTQPTVQTLKSLDLCRVIPIQALMTVVAERSAPPCTVVPSDPTSPGPAYAEAIWGGTHLDGSNKVFVGIGPDVADGRSEACSAAPPRGDSLTTIAGYRTIVYDSTDSAGDNGGFAFMCYEKGVDVDVTVDDPQFQQNAFALLAPFCVAVVIALSRER